MSAGGSNNPLICTCHIYPVIIMLCANCGRKIYRCLVYECDVHPLVGSLNDPSCPDCGEELYILPDSPIPSVTSTPPSSPLADVSDSPLTDISDSPLSCSSSILPN